MRTTLRRFSCSKNEDALERVASTGASISNGVAATGPAAGRSLRDNSAGATRGTNGGLRMSGTEPLFQQDAYLRSCTARVTEVLPDGVVLDRTVFYPLGG